MIQALPAFTVSCPSCRSEFPVDPRKVPVRGVHAICSTCLRVFRVERPEKYAGVGVGDGSMSAGHSVEALEAAAALDLPPDTVFDEAGPDDLEISGFSEGADAIEVLEDIQVTEELEISIEVDAEDEAEVEEVALADEVAAPAPEAPPASAPVAEAPAAPSAAPAPPAEPPPAPAAPPQPKRPPAIVDLTSLAQEAIAEGGELTKAQLANSSLSLGAEKFRKRGPQERAQRLARVLVSDIIAYYPARYRESFARGTLKDDFQEEVKKSWKEYVDQVGQELAESTPYFNEALNEILGQGQKVF